MLQKLDKTNNFLYIINNMNIIKMINMLNEYVIS